MFRDSICICWQIENKNMSRIGVRHCSKWFKSRLKNIQATKEKKKKESKFCEAQPNTPKT